MPAAQHGTATLSEMQIRPSILLLHADNFGLPMSHVMPFAEMLLFYEQGVIDGRPAGNEFLCQSFHKREKL